MHMLNVGFLMMRLIDADHNAQIIYVAKTKVLISCAVMYLCFPLYKKQVFSRRGSLIFLQTLLATLTVQWACHAEV